MNNKTNVKVFISVYGTALPHPTKSICIVLFFTLKEISVDTSALYCDIRGLQEERPELYDPDDYSKSQTFAKKQHKNGENGIIYDSVRHEGGECAAVFTEERLKSDAIKDIALYWDGEDFSAKE